MQAELSEVRVLFELLGFLLRGHSENACRIHSELVPSPLGFGSLVHSVSRHGPGQAFTFRYCATVVISFKAAHSALNVPSRQLEKLLSNRCTSRSEIPSTMAEDFISSS